MSKELEVKEDENKPKLTELQSNILQLWSSGIKPAIIAQELKCSRNTVYSLMRKSENRRLFYQAQAEAIQSLVPKAIQRLSDILDDKKAPAATVLLACKEVIERARVHEQAGLINDSVKITIEYK